MSDRTGSCMCGAVRFTARTPETFGVCHCVQCRKWAGSALFAITVPEAGMTLHAADSLRSIRSSDWASRAHCGDCGSVLWYRWDKGQDGAGAYEVAIGLLDNADGLALEREIFADEKPDSWSLVGTHQRMTRAETIELYGGPSSGS